MSTVTAQQTTVDCDKFADLIENFADEFTLPEAPWLTKLDLDFRRENLNCLSPSTRVSKRILDIVGSITLMILCIPIFIVIPILMAITMPGKIIYSQTRVGVNLRKRRDRRQSDTGTLDGEDRRQSSRRDEGSYGKPFTIYKFRTMLENAELNGAQLATEDDPRVTKLGRFMRRTRIDELPQLWNILRGDMSLVGPRPEREEFVKSLSEEIPNYLNRLGLRPGLSGIAQIENGYDDNIESFRRKVAYDLLYLQNCCLINDLKILLRTVYVVITGKGAL